MNNHSGKYYAQLKFLASPLGNSHIVIFRNRIPDKFAHVGPHDIYNLSQKKTDAKPMLIYCITTVNDTGPAFKERLVFIEMECYLIN